MKTINLTFAFVFGFLISILFLSLYPQVANANHTFGNLCADGTLISAPPLTGSGCEDHGGVIHPGNENLYNQCSDGIWVSFGEDCANHGGECEGECNEEPEAPIAITCADGTVVTRGGPIPDDQLCDAHGGPADPSATSTTLTCADGQEGIALSNGDCLPFDEEADTALEDNPIIKYLGIIINFLLAGVGIVITGVIIIAGIQYITSEGKPDNINAAKDKIFKALVSLVAYIFAGAIINWLVPGGLL